MYYVKKAVDIYIYDTKLIFNNIVRMLNRNREGNTFQESPESKEKEYGKRQNAIELKMSGDSQIQELMLAVINNYHGDREIKITKGGGMAPSHDCLIVDGPQGWGCLIRYSTRGKNNNEPVNIEIYKKDLEKIKKYEKGEKVDSLVHRDLNKQYKELKREEKESYEEERQGMIGGIDVNNISDFVKKILVLQEKVDNKVPEHEIGLGEYTKREKRYEEFK